MLKEQRLSSTTLYDGKILRLERDEIEHGDGKRAFREIVRHSGGAGVLFVQDGKVLLVKQYRYAYGCELYEIPAGKLDGTEDPCNAALRELAEETGYLASHAQLLARIYPSPGYTDEVISVYLVTSATPAAAHPDEGEHVQAQWFALDEVARMIDTGELADAKTVVAFLRYQQLLRD